VSPGILQLVLILLATAVLVVVIFRVLRLPALLGYLLVGIVIGPHALGVVPDTWETRYLAEFGVVFLMFSIGLEFSLPKLVTMRRMVFGLGAAQVGAVLVLGIAGAAVLAAIGARVSSSAVFSPCPPPPSWPRCWRNAWSSIPCMAARSSASCCSRISPWCRC